MTRAPRQCQAFLRWALPRLNLRPEGYRRVRRQVCRRLDVRRQELGLGDVAEYQDFIEAHPEEWEVLRGLCRITISRFYRDAAAWDALREQLWLRDPSSTLACWCVGCASGEEPWTLQLIGQLDPRAPQVRVLATDIDSHMVFRARAARYPDRCLRELPSAWREQAFERNKDALRLRDVHRVGVAFEVQDLCAEMPDGPFDLISCRYLAFTYFDGPRREQILSALVNRLAPGGFVFTGPREAVPEVTGLQRIAPGLYELR